MLPLYSMHKSQLSTCYIQFYCQWLRFLWHSFLFFSSSLFRSRLFFSFVVKLYHFEIHRIEFWELAIQSVCHFQCADVWVFYFVYLPMKKRINVWMSAMQMFSLCILASSKIICVMAVMLMLMEHLFYNDRQSQFFGNTFTCSHSYTETFDLLIALHFHHNR